MADAKVGITRFPTLVHDGSFLSRYLISILLEKQADIAIKVVEDVGEFYDHIPSDNFLVDREVVVYGPPLLEYVHERYPAPLLVPVSPSDKAKLRMATEEVVSWYTLSLSDLETKLLETSDAYSGTPFFLSRNISTADFALAPLFDHAIDMGLRVFNDTAFKTYVKRVITWPSVEDARRLCDY